MTDIKTELENHTIWAKEVLMRTNAFTPMFIVECDIGRVPILAQFTSDDDKANCYRFVRLFCLAHDAQALIMLAEAWITTITPDGKSERTEALAATISRRDGSRHASFHTIERDGGGNVTDVYDDPADDSTTLTFDLIDLLPKGDVSDYQRAGALAALDIMVPNVGVDPTVH